MRDHGRAGGSHHEHEFLGTNSRLDALQAVVLSAKLPRLAGWTDARRRLAGHYRARLQGGPARLVDEMPHADHTYHLLVARVPARDRVRRGLQEAGVETGLHYPTPCHLLAPYRDYRHGPLPVAERTAGEIVSLPMFPHMTTEQVERVCTALQEQIVAEADPDVA
jgi:dTDP-4-amino-4,6-dideoxygalactose transaminase